MGSGIVPVNASVALKPGEMTRSRKAFADLESWRETAGR
jgi:hypothetical protein